MTNKSGTVRYHRADYHPGTDEPWLVWFTKDQADPYWFTAAQGEAMGLTPPEPAPLDFTKLPSDEIPVGSVLGNRCDGAVQMNVVTPEGLGARLQDGTWHVAPLDSHNQDDYFLVWSARQDPQPASDEPNTHVLIGSGPHVRPITPKPQPEQDDTSGIDFDALPGTVLQDREKDYWVKLPDRWIMLADDHVSTPDAFYAPYTVVYQPAPLSPGECLRGLLAGRDDAYFLLAEAQTFKRFDAETPVGQWLQVIGDAAREVHG